jgi:ABC-type multidrug transport system fused ATPase/permease subunit
MSNFDSSQPTADYLKEERARYTGGMILFIVLAIATMLGAAWVFMSIVDNGVSLSRIIGLLVLAAFCVTFGILSQNMAVKRSQFRPSAED